MTISNASRTAGPFVGNGITKEFPFSYKVFDRADVLVAQTVTATGVETIKTLDADYTVTLNSDQDSSPGGVIRMIVAPAVGTTLAATSNIPLVQALNLTNQGGFHPKVINDALDRIVINIQQLAARIGLGSLNVGSAATIAKVLGLIDVVASSVGAKMVGFTQGLPGAVDTTIEAVLRETLNVKRMGAKADGVTNDSAALVASIDERHLRLTKGTYRLEQGVDFQPWPTSLEGDPSGTVVLVADEDTKFGFRFGAAGYATPDGVDGRQITSVRGITFISDIPGAAGLRIQIVHPLFLDLVRFFKMGGKALEMFQQYYGRAQNVVFHDSGVFFTNVNNFSIDGGDFGGIANSQNYALTDWGSILSDCDGVSFHNLTFEGWRNRVLKLIDCKNISFNTVWFEANTCDEMMRFEQSTAIAFNDCFLELYPTPSAAFIGVDNGAVIGAPRSLLTNITVRGGHIRLDISTGAPPFVNVAPGSKAVLLVDGSTLDSGHLFVRGNARTVVRNLTLSSATDPVDRIKTLHSMPCAMLSQNFNSWVPASRQFDWDFALGAGVVEVGTAALAIGIGTGDGEFMTGTRGVKVSGIPADGNRYVISKPMEDMGPVTVEGETHLIFVRFKPSSDMSIIFAVEGFFAEYEWSPDITFQGNQWHDFVIKTASDVTWNVGRQGYPKLHIKVRNTSGAPANFFIDRIDYQTVRGDVYLP